eukprot:112309-Hanusia_phi.AAC.2
MPVTIIGGQPPAVRCVTKKKSDPETGFKSGPIGHGESRPSPASSEYYRPRSLAGTAPEYPVRYYSDPGHRLRGSDGDRRGPG